MRRAALARSLTAWFLGGLLLGGMDTAGAQSPPAGRSQKAGPTAGTQAQTQTNRRDKSSSGKPVAGKAQAPAGNAPRHEFSEAYRESLRRTVEKRRQLRARRRLGAAASQPIGAIVPWPMPPALIIRHTREVHGEVGSFLDVLRR